MINASLSIHINIGFPSYESFKVKPSAKTIFSCLLNCDTIVFNDFAHARPFFNCILQFYGINYYSKKGLLVIPHNGREIFIQILGLTINSQLFLKINNQLESENDT